MEGFELARLLKKVLLPTLRLCERNLLLGWANVQKRISSGCQICDINAEICLKSCRLLAVPSRQAADSPTGSWDWNDRCSRCIPASDC